MKRKVLSTLLAATMVASVLTGCGSKTESTSNTTTDSATSKTDTADKAEATDTADASSTEQGKIVNIYCWNDEFKSRYEAYAADLAETHGVEVNFVIVANENNAYQNNLDAALTAQESAAADDKVDVFLIEADYASKYTKTDFTLDVINDVGLTAEDLSGQYQYTKDIVSVDGVQKGTTWQATPGLFAYRRSIAKEVLGTDDPTEVQAMLSDWTKFDEVAAKMKDSGYFMLSGYDDAFRTFSNNVSAPWVSGTQIVIDDNIMKWVEQTKLYTDNGYNNKTTLWAPEWSADQGPAGKVFGFFYSTWGINFTLLGNSLEDAEGEQAVGNGIFGDYAVCEGPQAYYWGGTWICAAKGTDNIPFIKDMMYRLTCDAATMKQITLDTQDYTNNVAAMEEIAGSDYASDFLGGQNHIALFSEAAKKIDMSNISDYDQGLNESIQQAMHEYFEGNVDLDTALENFYTAAMEKYPELTK
ncbi:MAG: carbohydrate ABC transporter substrate-binding protein [Lachnospiraceae bacterium]|nr:carbohydrate ABC transporter substrate-binding protein [Lachnospiraceae bacterium]